MKYYFMSVDVDTESMSRETTQVVEAKEQGALIALKEARHPGYLKELAFHPAVLFRTTERGGIRTELYVGATF